MGAALHPEAHTDWKTYMVNRWTQHCRASRRRANEAVVWLSCVLGVACTESGRNGPAVSSTAAPVQEEQRVESATNNAADERRASRSEEDSSSMVSLRVRITWYAPDALNEDYEDGTYRSFDLTHVEVLAPEEFAGRTIKVTHWNDPPEGSPWRDVGGVYDVVIDRRDLGKDIDPYEGAFKEIKKVDGGEREEPKGGE